METVLISHDNRQPVGTNGDPSRVSFSQPLTVSPKTGLAISKEHSVITVNPLVPEGEQLEKQSLNPVDSAKRREVLSRRPSYRRILNELSSTDVMRHPDGTRSNLGEMENEEDMKITQVEVKTSQQNMTTPDNKHTSIYQNVNDSLHASPEPIHISVASINNNVTLTSSIPSIQGFTMANTLSQGQETLMIDNNQGNAMWMPGSHVVVQTAGGGMQAFQIQESPSNIMVSPNSMSNNIQSPHQMAEDASRKRELRLMKNRDAAKECRRRKKEYVKCLETRVAVLEHQNKQLIDELKTLKELYVHKQVDTG